MKFWTFVKTYVKKIIHSRDTATLKRVLIPILSVPYLTKILSFESVLIFKVSNHGTILFHMKQFLLLHVHTILLIEKPKEPNLSHPFSCFYRFVNAEIDFVKGNNTYILYGLVVSKPNIVVIKFLPFMFQSPAPEHLFLGFLLVHLV